MVLIYFIIYLEVLIRGCEKSVFFLGVFIVELSFIFDIIERRYKNQTNAENNYNKNC